jgi:hypothetical protein
MQWRPAVAACSTMGRGRARSGQVKQEGSGERLTGGVMEEKAS